MKANLLLYSRYRFSIHTKIKIPIIYSKLSLTNDLMTAYTARLEAMLSNIQKPRSHLPSSAPFCH